MAVYEANVRSLAEYISDTKLGFIPKEVKSTTGYRVSGSQYLIEAHDINCDRIYVVNDCFIGTDGNIVVISYIPAVEYSLITNELSPCYGKGKHLSFKYETESQVVRYTVEKNIELNSYSDFEDCMNCLIEFIGQNIEKSMNEFRGSWRIDDVVCDIVWQVDKIKK